MLFLTPPPVLSCGDSCRRKADFFYGACSLFVTVSQSQPHDDVLVDTSSPLCQISLVESNGVLIPVSQLA